MDYIRVYIRDAVMALEPMRGNFEHTLLPLPHLDTEIPNIPTRADTR